MLTPPSLFFLSSQRNKALGASSGGFVFLSSGGDPGGAETVQAGRSSGGSRKGVPTEPGVFGRKRKIAFAGSVPGGSPALGGLWNLSWGSGVLVQKIVD